MNVQEYAEKRRRRIEALEATLLGLSALAAIEATNGSPTWAYAVQLINNVLNEE